MFKFKKQTEPDNRKIDLFCAWFIENSEKIILSVENRKNDQAAMYSMLDEVEVQLAKVYRDGYKGDIEFEYGFNSNIGKWELNLFHLNDDFLILATTQIAKRINAGLKECWSVNVEW